MGLSSRKRKVYHWLILFALFAERNYQRENNSIQNKYESNENTKTEEAARRQLLVSATLHFDNAFSL